MNKKLTIINKMQLFITNNFEIKNNKVILKEERIFHQLRKVLRVQKGYKFAIQPLVYPKNNINILRYYLIFEIFDNKLIETKVEKIEKINYQPIFNGIATAVLNKYSKIELIVQKLTEFGIENIIFWYSKRSIIKEFSKHRLERLQRIMLEAAEQSWNLFVPNLIILKEIKQLFTLNFLNYFIADFLGKKANCKVDGKKTVFIIGPEGGFDEIEKNFLYQKAKVISLGENVLRAETAAIVSGRLVS